MDKERSALGADARHRRGLYGRRRTPTEQDHCRADTTTNLRMLTFASPLHEPVFPNRAPITVRTSAVSVEGRPRPIERR
jgi:hypothetical protein